MREGYGVHPDRFIVLVENPKYTSGEFGEAFKSLVMQYIENDFITLFDYDIETKFDVDNFYALSSLSDELKSFLKENAKIYLSMDDELSYEEFITTIKKALVREGFNNRDGDTVLLAVDDDETTTKIKQNCRLIF